MVNGEENKEKITLESVEVPAALVKALLDYLGQRPHREVAEGIAGLEKAVSAAIVAKEQANG